jgi:O-antigen/teichoic acid export membrane protein
VFWPSLAATLLILACGIPMLWLFGPKFVAAYPIMFILAVGFIARASIGPAERLLNMLGEQRLCAVVYAVAFTTNVIGCFALAGPYGGTGVAIATVTAFIVETALLFMVVKRRLGVHMLIWRPSAKA